MGLFYCHHNAWRAGHRNGSKQRDITWLNQTGRSSSRSTELDNVFLRELHSLCSLTDGGAHGQVQIGLC